MTLKLLALAASTSTPTPTYTSGHGEAQFAIGWFYFVGVSLIIGLIIYAFLNSGNGG